MGSAKLGRNLQKVRNAASIFVLVAGISCVAAHLLGESWWLTWGEPIRMRWATAVMFVITGVLLKLSMKPQSDKGNVMSVSLAGMLIFPLIANAAHLTTARTLSEYRILSNGGPSYATLVAFTFLAVSFLTISLNGKALHLRKLVGALTIFQGFVAILGYLAGSPIMYASLNTDSGISLPTAFLFILTGIIVITEPASMYPAV